jgi:hypothetical protein
VVRTPPQRGEISDDEDGEDEEGRHGSFPSVLNSGKIIG